MAKEIQKHKIGIREPVPVEIAADSKCIVAFGMTVRGFVQDYINDTTGKYYHLWTDEEQEKWDREKLAISN